MAKVSLISGWSRWTVLTTAATALLASSLRAQQFPPPLTPEQTSEVTRALDAMKREPRGPYLHLRWFCADGAVLPPAGTPCADRGGGNQHAVLSPQAERLQTFGFHVGTILQATPFDELFDTARANFRLREYVVGDYLVDVDDGWVLRQARFYRGARQIEDEEARGREFLERMLADTAWTRRNYFLAMQAVATVPHAPPGGEPLTQRIRNLATEIARLDSSFVRHRIKIHSFPSRADLGDVERFLARGSHAPDVQSRLDSLRTALAGQYETGQMQNRVAAYLRTAPADVREDLATIVATVQRGDAGTAVQRIGALSDRLRTRITSARTGREALLLADLNLRVIEEAFVLAPDAVSATPATATRAERVRAVIPSIRLAYGAGFLSARERDAVLEEIDRVLAGNQHPALEYRAALAYVARALDWGAATVRGVFAPVTTRYLAVEPRTLGFDDAIVRGSPLLPLSRTLDALSEDADRILGASHRIVDQDVTHGVRGLNAGVALAPLDVLARGQSGDDVRSDRIYLLRETPSDLRPLAGALTVDEGNMLSHVQLLARNLGIPNASMSESLFPVAETARGQRVFFAVSPLGRVVLKREADLSPADRTLVSDGAQRTGQRYRLDTSRLDLTRTQPIPLARLRTTDSGILVGPKAANLGQLAAFFPEHVSPGVALPFGLFVRHANRRFDTPYTVLDELGRAYTEAESMRRAGRTDTDIDAFMFAELARVRRAIIELPWTDEVRGAIVTAIRETFGADVSAGVFIRSDTNVEDLPQFSGAGLNLTVANQRTEEAILSAIKRVWTSPFSERAYLWRKRILEDQGRIYPSVLLLQSVPSDKSGVLISSGLHNGERQDVTVATAEGVGGAVDGDDAETIVARPDGSVRLLSQAKAPSRRALINRDAGGAEMVPARQPEMLLTPRNVEDLREVVTRWRRGFDLRAEQVWDIEFGFVGDKLWLFQIRPFIQFRSSALLDRLRVLDADIMRNANRPVRMDRAP